MAKIPTMIVWGGRDRLTPVQHARHPQRAIPNSRLQIFPKAWPLPALGGAAPVRRPAGGLRRTDRGPAGADRGAALDRQAGPRLGGDVSARTSGIDALAWTAPTRRASATGRPPPRRTPRRQRLSRRSDRTASELGYVLRAGVAGAFAGDPTRCPGIRLDVGEAPGRRRSRRMPVAERGRRNQSEVSAPAMLRRTAAPQCRVCRRRRGSASSAIGDKAVHSWGCPVLWACRPICAVAAVVAPTRRTGRLVWANAAVTAWAVIAAAIRWSQRFPPSCRKVSPRYLTIHSSWLSMNA